MTGRAEKFASWMIRFWARGTRSKGSSTPRSPRATITASVSARISSIALSAWTFSIFATTRARPPVRPFRSTTSSGRRTKLSPTYSTSWSSANSRSTRSLGVSEGARTATVGRLIPFRLLSSPPRTTRSRVRAPSVPVQRSSSNPSSRRTASPSTISSASGAYVVGISSAAASSSGAITTVSPTVSRMGSESSPTRILGPARVHEDRHRRSDVAGRVSNGLDRGRVVLRRPVRHVDARHVHAGPDHGVHGVGLMRSTVRACTRPWFGACLRGLAEGRGWATMSREKRVQGVWGGQHPRGGDGRRGNRSLMPPPRWPRTSREPSPALPDRGDEPHPHPERRRSGRARP